MGCDDDEPCIVVNYFRKVGVSKDMLCTEVNDSKDAETVPLELAAAWESLSWCKDYKTRSRQSSQVSFYACEYYRTR